MIVRSGDVAAIVEDDGAQHTVETRRVSDAAGLSQFAAKVQTLAPGAQASTRHWHVHTDEFLYVLDGELTVVDDRGAHVLAPGDAVGWPANEGNAHTVQNRSPAPCRYLMVGTRLGRDVVHYPSLGRTLVIDSPRWHIEDADGHVLHEGREDAPDKAD